MKKSFIGLIVAVALIVGVGGGYLAAKAISNRGSFSARVGADSDVQPGIPGWNFGPGDQDDNGGQFPWNETSPQWRMGPGMMNPQGRMNPQWRKSQGRFDGGLTRNLSLDVAVAQAQAYASRVADNLVVSRVFEFSNGFFAIINEKDSGKGAFGLYLPLDRNSPANVVGPVHDWNAKYTSDGVKSDADPKNAVSMADAAAAAQKELDGQKLTAKVDAQGVDFYGYYTFTYQVDGKVAGLISVNGTNSKVWNYTELGTFVSQEEVK